MPEHIAQHVEALLKEEGFTVDRVTPMVPAHAPEQDDTLTLRIFVKGKHAEWACMIRCFEQSARLLVYSLYPEQVEAALRNRISELICRINYGLILGNFEMDWEDGELRYKTSMDIESIEINRTVMRNLVYGNFHSFDMYFNAIAQGLRTERDLDTLVLEAENPDMPTGFDLVDETVH